MRGEAEAELQVVWTPEDVRETARAAEQHETVHRDEILDGPA